MSGWDGDDKVEEEKDEHVFRKPKEFCVTFVTDVERKRLEQFFRTYNYKFKINTNGNQESSQEKGGSKKGGW